ncbi:MAG: hypothetical protein AAB887_00105 [Patescibacteria group bacterium]
MELRDGKFGRVTAAIRSDEGDASSQIGRVAKQTDARKLFVVGVLATLDKFRKAKLQKWWRDALRGQGETAEETAGVREYIDVVSSE